jgi:trimeric autotransporter adhesin
MVPGSAWEMDCSQNNQHPVSTKNEKKNMTTPHLKKSIGRSLFWQCGFVLIPLALACFGLSPAAKAVLPPPPPDGGYLGANTAEGTGALFSLTSGINNTAVGANALHDNTAGGYNVAIGSGALASNVTGNFNMAVGTEALTNNTASFNLAIGFRVGFMNTTGNHLTGVGAAALRNNTTAGFNTAIGADALEENTVSEFNVAVGDGALAIFNGTTTNDGSNTALGSIALGAEASGEQNVAVGRLALGFLPDGSNNVAVGWRAGANYIQGESGNICIGWNTAGERGENNSIRIGDASSSGGIDVLDSGPLANFVTIGPDLSTQGISVSTLGDGFGNVSIGNGLLTTFGSSACNIGGIYNQPFGPADMPVRIGSDNKLGTVVSSRRFKHDIKPIDKASEAILALKPVTFHYKSDTTNTPRFGLIAEDVAEVSPALVIPDKEGKPLSVRYEDVNVMLLNEFLKEHKKVEEQQASIADLKSTVALQQKEMQVLTAQFKEQTAQIQKVSAQLTATEPAARLVTNQ